MSRPIEREPGRTPTGSVQYIGGYIGPMDEKELEKEDPSQPMIPMGLEILEPVNKLVATQIVGDEAWYNLVHFGIQDGHGRTIMTVKEIKSLNGCLQALLGNSRPAYLKVINSFNNNFIMELERPGNCSSPVFCPWASPSLTVRMPTGEVLGHIRHSQRETCGSWLSPSYYFEIYNYQGNRKYRVQGPTGYPCECTRNSVASFKIYTEASEDENGKYVGEVSHVWRGCCGGVCSCCISGDPDRVTITFLESASAEDKALFLGLLLLVMGSYYELQ